MTDQNLERLGAKRIYRRGVGDDCQDIAEDFATWKGDGLWAALKKAIAEVRLEGPRTQAKANDAPVSSAPVTLKPEIHVFFAQEEADGAAKDVCEEFQKCCKSDGIEVSIVQSLSDRKAVEAVKKMPKKALAVLISDVSPDGSCSAARKLVRNMSIEMDSAALADKDLRYMNLTVATSKCNSSAASSKSQIQTHGEVIPKAFDRAGVKPMEQSCPCYVDAGVEDVGAIVKQVCSAVAKYVTERSITVGGGQANGDAPAAAAAAPPQKVRIFCAGDEAKEAAEALSGVWKNDTVTVEDASLGALANAAQQKAQAVLAVECAADGSLSDSARGLAAQLGAAPMAIKAQLRQLRFALIAVAATDYGNAGERASASAALAELTRAAAPISKALAAAGAGCVASCSLDLQDAGEGKLVELCTSLKGGFTAGLGGTTPAKTEGYAASANSVTYGTPVLKMLAPGALMPSESPGEPSETLARFYFDSQKAKVLKVKELRQQPNFEEGLSTVEVEIEAAGDLKGYTLGGTLSLLPENDEADVAAALKLFGLTEADLARPITFTAKEGPTVKVKRPFPTPCTLGDALKRYCDLARAPTKKMLTALQPKLTNPEAKACVEKLLQDSEAMKILHSAASCCRMHEFWELLGIRGPGGIDPGDFLLHCPRQKPREFTIASSPKASPDRITLCVSLTSSETTGFSELVASLGKAGCLPASTKEPSRGRFYGMCSRWLSAKLKTGDFVMAKHRPSPLTLPAKDVPVIMIGSGAGVAPFRGFWEELRRGSQTKPAALFFGCRHPEQDWLFKDEMNGAVKLATGGCSALAKVQVGPKRPLTCLFPAFSRPGEGKEKKYVQDLLLANKLSVQTWVDKMDGAVFICGSSAMGHGVLDALGEILEGGKEAVEALRKDGRIVAEMWG
eukprot:TRINITY_DN2847_c0_g3_i1.p1 TRINITY_DN2847_c0_g3~~TRINITY_DN2847_c0_g3_i1.p1  ORF type:complete len:963 (+),score=262.38 TRINITY_DN2847_c0_g3_i1:173-2890(+)